MARAGDERIDELYGLPLDEFTAARNGLAKELRGEGERESAAIVAKLRKPSRASWAINRAVRDRPEAARALLDAAEALARAQEKVISGSGRAALDEAVAAEREATEQLLAAVKTALEEGGSASPAIVDRARKTLHAVAGDPELQSELAAGRVSTDREPIGFGTAPIPSATRKPAEPEAERAEAGPDAGAGRASRKQLAEARRRAERAERRLAAGERNLGHARERLEKARDALAAAESDEAELERELEDRRRERDDANAVLEELT